jgi:hypothetical protein
MRSKEFHERVFDVSGVVEAAITTRSPRLPGASLPRRGRTATHTFTAAVRCFGEIPPDDRVLILSRWSGVLPVVRSVWAFFTGP